ncbi:PAS domain S-box protein [Verrucomicrobium sp. BvORR106]|uniref:PAS domain-containing hybrid sensor histidine kinase/response regulator n=1 Tax=Verrucomicrobium sp. BvORR106 TaxID=1403819 RepID=UPI0022410198|nr:PAS domain S-box protein [Verrucomicrobium sp. BvORR106]
MSGLPEASPARRIHTPTAGSARATAEEQLLESEALFHMAGRMARLGGWVVEVPPERCLWSAEVCEIHEMPVGTSPTVEEGIAFYAPGWRDKIQKVFTDCLEQGMAWDEEMQIRTAKGRLVWVRVIGQAVRDERGQIIRVHGAFQDITDKKQAEEALRESEQTLAALMFNLPCAVYLFGQDGRMLRWNGEFEKVTGYSAQEIEGMIPEQFIVPDDVAAVRARIVEAFTHGHAVAELRLRSKTGDMVPYIYSASRILMEGQPCLLGVGMDMSAQRQAEAQLREQADLLDKAQDAILVVNLAHRITYWNKGAQQLYGWSSEEALGKEVADLLHAELREFQGAFTQVNATGEWTGELKQQAKDGRSLIVESRWDLVRDDQGQPRSLLVINTDITEKKRLERQFFRAQRMESIGTLAGGMAHDLNNVLSPIMMAVDLLKLKTSDSGSQELLGNIATSAKRGADMVGQVLSFARGVEGRRDEVHAGRLVDDVERIIRDTFPKNIQIRTNVGSDLWTVTGDLTQLHQVLLNLCVNARDAMPEGGNIAISVENITLDAHYAAMNLEAKAGPYLVIQVEDTGTGIPAAILDKIFDPFFTTKAVGKGTGLGLSTSMAIIKSHGGFMRARSELGKGAKFRIYLPARSVGQNQPAPDEDSKVPRGKGETVLVVDDEAAIRMITRQTLEAFGYKVILACDGAEAVTTYVEHRQQIALVLTDMMMPVMDGEATIKVLTKMNPAIKIVAVSGVSASDVTAKAAGASVKTFLPKPYTAKTLLKVVKDVIAL